MKRTPTYSGPYRMLPQHVLNFGGLVVDLFAGGGGASTGIEQAIGRPVDIAINHDIDAIRMHEVNHPQTRHYCESVWDVDPREVCAGRPVDLLWASPDCKHFSKAKGGKPREKAIRGLAWSILRWVATVRPKVVMLENVEEFKTWGPLLENGQPCPKRKGRTFNAFVNAFKRHGYAVEWRELRACDYGAPTIRKRLFLAETLSQVVPALKGLFGGQIEGSGYIWEIHNLNHFGTPAEAADFLFEHGFRAVVK